MMKKTLLAIALSALSLTTFAATDTPDILSALSNDTTQQIALMTDEQLSETKGSGIAGYALSAYYYAWNFSGSKQDYRSYIYTMGSSISGGQALGNNLYKVGNIFYTTTQGINAPTNAYSVIEQHTVSAYNSAIGPQGISSTLVSFSNWNRPSNLTYW